MWRRTFVSMRGEWSRRSQDGVGYRLPFEDAHWIRYRRLLGGRCGRWWWLLGNANNSPKKSNPKVLRYKIFAINKIFAHSFIIIIPSYSHILLWRVHIWVPATIFCPRRRQSKDGPNIRRRRRKGSTNDRRRIVQLVPHFIKLSLLHTPTPTQFYGRILN